MLVHLSHKRPSDHYAVMQAGSGAIHGLASMHGGGVVSGVGGPVASAMTKAAKPAMWGVVTGKHNPRGAALKILAAGGHAAVHHLTGSGLGKRSGGTRVGTAKRQRLM